MHARPRRCCTRSAASGPYAATSTPQLIAAVRAAGGATTAPTGSATCMRRTDSGHTWDADLDDLRRPGGADLARLPSRTAHGALRPVAALRLRRMRLRPAVCRPAPRPGPARGLRAGGRHSGTDAADDTDDDSPQRRRPATTSSPTEEATEAGLSPECAPDQLPHERRGPLTVAHRLAGLRAVVRRRRPDQRPGLRVRGGLRRRRAARLHDDQVEWVVVPFNTSYKPGAKDFDFDINQISITPGAGRGRGLLRRLLPGRAGGDRAQGRRRSPRSTTIAELADYNLGAQTGTTSLTAIRDVDPAGQRPGRLRGHQRRQAGAAQRPGRRDPGRPADRVLHLRGGDPEEHDRRTVPAGDRRAGGVRDALREGQPAGRLRQRGAGRARRPTGRSTSSSSSGSPTSWTCPVLQ